MKKKNFVSLVMGTIGGILFAVGMCMCLLPEWNAFTQGIFVTGFGAVALLALVIVRRKMEGKPAVRLNGKIIAAIALGSVGVLGFGLGLCMTMVWAGLMIPGIIVGVVCIVLLMGLVPICKGLK